MEVLVEFLVQIVFELVAELLSGAFGSGGSKKLRSDGAAKTSAGPVRARGLWLIQVVVAAGFGLWRGGLTGGSPRWGFWLALAVAFFAVLFAALAAPSSPEPTTRIRALLLWWPRWRLFWFGLANAVFVVAYVAAMAGADAPLG